MSVWPWPNRPNAISPFVPGKAACAAVAFIEGTARRTSAQASFIVRRIDLTLSLVSVLRCADSARDHPEHVDPAARDLLVKLLADLVRSILADPDLGFLGDLRLRHHGFGVRVEASP